MTFLNPLVLLGLAAAAIPVLLHLLNLRKLRVIEFSTLSFLKELQQSKIRKLKLRQLLLLIVRTLLVVFVVLAFARPALRGTLLGTIGTNAHSTVVIILDDSFSMSANDNRGELFHTAKETAIRLTGLLHDGDEANVIRLSDLPAATVDPATHDFGILRKVISESTPSAIRRPMDDAIRLSARLIAPSRNANKEVYVISDFQRTLFPTHLQAGTAAAASLFEPDVKFFTCNVGSGQGSNTAVDSVEIATAILEKGKPVQINATAGNFSGNPLTDDVISVFLDGVRMGQTNVHVEPWGASTVKFMATPKRSGTIRGYVELEQDALDDDNRRYFTVMIPEKIVVVHVEGTPGEGKFPLLALSAGMETESLFEIRETTLEHFPLMDLTGVDELLLTGLKTSTQAVAGKIRSFVERGGGLLLFPGSAPDITRLNADLLGSLSIPPVEGMTSDPERQSHLSFRGVDVDHPVFSGMFESAAGERSVPRVESPSIFTSLQRHTGKEARTIITLSDGSPFLTEHHLGRGTIFFFSVAAVIQWSDFPLKGIFAPLVHRSAIYLASRLGHRASFMTGEEPIMRIDTSPVEVGGSSSGRQYSLSSPDGISEILQLLPATSERSFSGGALTFKLPRLRIPGFYEIRSGGVTVETFTVNTDPLESDGRMIAPDDLERFWESLGISNTSVRELEPTDRVQASVLESRFGTELWRYCLGIALLLALIEMAIARDSRKAAGEMVA